MVAKAFPVIDEVLGEACFRAICHDYVSQQASYHRNLDYYPANFPPWLAAQLPDYQYLKEYTYLPDLARLEWALYWIENCTNSGRMDFGSFARLDQDQQASARLLLAAVKLLSVSHPVYEIWHGHQESGLQTPWRDKQNTHSGCFLMVYRPQWRARALCLTTDEMPC